MKIEMRTVHVGISRCCVHANGEDTECTIAGIVSGPHPSETEWRDIEDNIDYEPTSPMQRFVIEAELPFRPTFKVIDVVKPKKMVLQASLHEVVDE